VSRALKGNYAPPLVLATGYALLLLSWAVANPPFAAPDEPAHYLRAIAVGGGSLAGEPMIDVPSGLWAAEDLACNAFLPESSAACLDRIEASDRRVAVESGAGLYPPLAYAVPGVAARAASSPEDADRVARLVTVAISVALFLGAAVLLWEPMIGLASLLGMIVATTPMVLFACSMLNSSALETAAGLAFAAALLRLSRLRPPEAWVWLVVAGSGTLLALSRSTGILWLVLDVALFLGLVGVSGIRTIVRSDGKALVATAATLILAIGANRAWEARYGTEVTQSGPFAFAWRDKVGESFSEFGRLGREWVGTFGWLDTSIPLWASLAWLSIGAALILTAVAVGRVRERLTLITALVATVGSAVLLSSTLRAGELGGDVQARHLLPFLVMIPLLAGEIVARNLVRVRAIAVIVVVAAGLHTVAWYWNARRHATGTDGSIFFFPEAEWAPPLGWAFWFAVTIAGASLTIAFALAGPRKASLPAADAIRSAPTPRR